MNDKERVPKASSCHMYMAVRRNKENPDLKELTIRQIIYEGEDSLMKLKRKFYNVPGVWRIYKTINARDFEIARKLVMVKLINQPEEWSYRINTLWRKMLLKKECKIGRNYLLDIDTKDDKINSEIFDIIKKNNIETFDEKETPNGYHVVAKGFDTRLFKDMEFVTIQSDGSLFIDRIEVK